MGVAHQMVKVTHLSTKVAHHPSKTAHQSVKIAHLSMKWEWILANEKGPQKEMAILR